tara:strand:+ start:333 stop:599 length:267 start_codon:yes stop_codon:yes gene_type:complete
MNEQIFFTIPEAAAFLFPDRPGSGGEQALRRMVKAKEIDVSWCGKQALISRATLLSYGVNSLSTASPALRVVKAQGLLHKANDETGAD